jgi:hypothetical protein
MDLRGGDGGTVGFGSGALSMFLPEDDPNRTSGSDGLLAVCLGSYSPARVGMASGTGGCPAGQGGKAMKNPPWH